jgi:hypothetical protein
VSIASRCCSPPKSHTSINFGRAIHPRNDIVMVDEAVCVGRSGALPFGAQESTPADDLLCHGGAVESRNAGILGVPGKREKQSRADQSEQTGRMAAL